MVISVAFEGVEMAKEMGVVFVGQRSGNHPESFRGLPHSDGLL